MTPNFKPGPLVRLFQRARIPRKLGVGEALFRHTLSKRGITWVNLGTLRWKLNLANDTHRWLVYGEYEEPGVRRLLERILDSQSVVIDSGANVGQMVLMYFCCGQPSQVHAFEPAPAARAWLAECVTQNRLTSVRISALALGEVAGHAHLVDHDFQEKDGAQTRIVESGSGPRIEVITLDAYAKTRGIERIRFWKLDTEGHELPALRGAASLLERGAIDYLYVETADAGGSIADELAKASYLAVPFALNRVLDREAVMERFTNVFISPTVAPDECGLV